MYEDPSSAEFYLNELAPLQDGTKTEEDESIGFLIHIEALQLQEASWQRKRGITVRNLIFQ